MSMDFLVWGLQFFLCFSTPYGLNGSWGRWLFSGRRLMELYFVFDIYDMDVSSGGACVRFRDFVAGSSGYSGNLSYLYYFFVMSIYECVRFI